MSRGWSRWVVMIIVRDCTDCCTIVTQIYHPSLTKLAPPTGLQRWPQKKLHLMTFSIILIWLIWKLVFEIHSQWRKLYILFLEFNFIPSLVFLFCSVYYEQKMNETVKISLQFFGLFVLFFFKFKNIFGKHGFIWKKCNCEIVGRISVELLMWTD